MGKLESFTIRMQPFMNYGDKWYEIQVCVNDQMRSVSKVISSQAPYEAEMDMLTRMGVEIARGIKDDVEHGSCCDCCERKSKCRKS